MILFRSSKKFMQTFADVSSSALMVIDCQDKILNQIDNQENIILNVRKLLKVASILKVETIFTEQNNSRLGKTKQELHQIIKGSVFNKLTFSCLGTKEIRDHLKKIKKKTIILCGVETHICVQQTAIDLVRYGYRVLVIVDAVGSRNEIDHKTALKRIEYSSSIISTTESIIYEICKTSARKEFKFINKVIKETSLS